MGGGAGEVGVCFFSPPLMSSVQMGHYLCQQSLPPTLVSCVCVYVVGGLKKKIEWHLHCMDGSKIKIKRNKVIKGDKNGVNKDRRSQFWVERRVNMIRRWWLIEKRKVENKKGSKT